MGKFNKVKKEEKEKKEKRKRKEKKKEKTKEKKKNKLEIDGVRSGKKKPHWGEKGGKGSVQGA